MPEVKLIHHYNIIIQSTKTTDVNLIQSTTEVNVS